MTTTPALPDWIRNAEVAGYATAHRLCPAETRLFGTESLYGDWDGRVLLLAKDFGPSKILHQRVASGDTRPYRHEPSMRTNRRLQLLVGPVVEQGLLYGSALGNLLRDDDMVSGTLPNREAALDYGRNVLRFTIERMPNLHWIVCLGAEAWDCACRARELAGDWEAHRTSGEPLGSLVAAYHPAARIPRELMARPWRALTAMVEDGAA